jgi:hypothetical protein
MRLSVDCAYQYPHLITNNRKSKYKKFQNCVMSVELVAILAEGTR